MALGMRPGTVLQRDTLWSSQGSAFSCGVGKAGRRECPRAGSWRGKGSPIPGVPVRARLPVLFHCTCVVLASEQGEESRGHLCLSQQRELNLGPSIQGALSKCSEQDWVPEYLGVWMGFSPVQSLSCVQLSATPWTAAHKATLSITNSRSPSKTMSIESVMPSNHLILCRPLLLLPSIFPSIRVFSNELALRIRWPKYWSFSFSISPSNEHPGLISFRMD